MSNIKLKRLAKKFLHHTWSLRTSASLYVAGGLLIAVVGLALVSRYAVSPAEGIIASFRSLPSTSARALDMTPVSARNNYATFRRPRGMMAMRSQTLHGSEVAVHNWKHNDIQTWRLAILIIDVPSYKMTDNNAYLFRKLNPSRFHESLVLVRGQPVPVMTDVSANGFSKVGFLRSGRYQAVVSLCGDDPRGQADLQSTLAMVLDSWHWLQS